MICDQCFHADGNQTIGDLIILKHIASNKDSIRTILLAVSGPHAVVVVLCVDAGYLLGLEKFHTA